MHIASKLCLKLCNLLRQTLQPPAKKANSKAKDLIIEFGEKQPHKRVDVCFKQVSIARHNRRGQLQCGSAFIRAYQALLKLIGSVCQL